MNDYYKTLGIDKSANADEVKRAYRKLAHEYHPDKKGGNEAKFKEINEAYQVLSDPKKREQYDQFGSAAFGSGGPFGGAQGGQGFDGFDFSQFGGFGRRGQDFNMEDIFDMFGGVFGNRSRSGFRRTDEEANRGGDIEVQMTISFYEMARGGSREIELNKENICEDCSGSGAKRGTGMTDCSVCRGKGEVKETVASIFGNITRINICKVCRGIGKVPKENCSSCLGQGRIRGKKTLEVNIPAGIKDGEALVVRGQGQAGFRGGKSGDLFVGIRVESDKIFKRVNNDIYYGLPLKLTDALLGKKILVPTVDGDREVEIPSGIAEGEELRLRGYGVHGRNKGDQIIKIKIEMPRKLSGRARRLVEELSSEI